MDILDRWYAQETGTTENTKYDYQTDYALKLQVGEEVDFGKTADILLLQEKVSKELRHLLDNVSYEKGTIFVTGIHGAYDDSDDWVPITLLVSPNEEYYRTLKEGNYDKDSSSVYVGVDIASVVEDNQVKLFGKVMKIGGIFKNYGVDEDREICVQYEDMTDEMKQLYVTRYASNMVDACEYEYEYEDRLFTISVGSNQSEKDMESAKEALEAIVKQYDILYMEPVEVLPDTQTESSTQAFRQLKNILMGIICLFSLINIYQITKVWIVKKRKNVAVMRACGVEYRKIYGRMYGELGVHMLVSFVVMMVLMAIVAGTHIYEVQSITQMLRVLVLSGVAFAGLVCILIAILMKKYLSGNLLQEMKKE